MKDSNTFSKHTKIVVTLGPACDDPQMIERLILAGANIFRFNFKHGEVAWHKDRVARVREASKKVGIPVGTMMDLQGPSFRIILDTPSKEITVGQEFVFGSQEFTLTHPHIIPSLIAGQKLLIDDGTITFEVKSVDQVAKTAVITSLSNALLKTRKSLNIPGCDFPIDLLTARDYEGIDIAVSEKMEIVAFSFSRTAKDIRDVREKLAERGCVAPICAKLETAQSLDNLEEIVQATDMVMVARGDLGVETPIQGVPIQQKRMIDLCLKYGKSVITATQMMASMEVNAFPTRAEVSDVANAVLDRSDAIMLSGESANGKYPVETVTMMASIARFTESNGKDYMRPITKLWLEDDSARVAHAAFKLMTDCALSGNPVAAFVVFTQSGRTARLISHFRSITPVYAFTEDPLVYGSLCVDFGVHPMFPPTHLQGLVNREHVQMALDALVTQGRLQKGNRVIILHGNEWGASGGTSTVRLLEVA